MGLSFFERERERSFFVLKKKKLEKKLSPTHSFFFLLSSQNAPKQAVKAVACIVTIMAGEFLSWSVFWKRMRA